MKLVRIVLAGAITCIGALPVNAQGNYPERTVRVIVPFAAGGATDAVARPWAEKMRQALGLISVANLGRGSYATYSPLT